MSSNNPYVVAVFAAKKHHFRKQRRDEIMLLPNLGVEGDAHCGAYVQHLFDRARDPARLNLRQVHLIEQELLADLIGSGFDIHPGELGENITTRNIDLIGLAAGTLLRLGSEAVLQISGLRAPCAKIDRFRPGLQKAVTDWRNKRPFMRGAVMAVVATGGRVVPGDGILIERPAMAAEQLRPI